MSTTMTLCASHAPGMDRDVDEQYGTTFRAGMAAARAAVAEFDPDLVVLFGGDHRRAFRSVVPLFAVAYTADLLPEGRIAAAELRVPTDVVRTLSEQLIAARFDIAVCRDVQLDHAFGQPLTHYLGSVRQAEVIPVPVNCASPPLPSARRALEFGQEIGRFLDGLDRRVLLIGTGGLSHSPPSLENDRHDLTEQDRRELIAAGRAAAVDRINPDWDKSFVDAMVRWDVDQLVAMADDATEPAGVGANEVRTWLAAAAAGGGRPMTTLAYEPVPEWLTGMGIVITTTEAR